MHDDITIRHDLRHGDLGRLISLHGEVYSVLDGYGLRFEAYVAQTIAEYVLDNDARGRIWLAERDGRLVGCTAIALRDNGSAQLRWVLVDAAARGVGLGRTLVNRALDYCRENGCSDVLGFVTVSDEPQELWDGVRPLIRMELTLA